MVGETLRPEPGAQNVNLGFIFSMLYQTGTELVKAFGNIGRNDHKYRFIYQTKIQTLIERGSKVSEASRSLGIKESELKSFCLAHGFPNITESLRATRHDILERRSNNLKKLRAEMRLMEMKEKQLAKEQRIIQEQEDEEFMKEQKEIHEKNQEQVERLTESAEDGQILDLEGQYVIHVPFRDTETISIEEQFDQDGDPVELEF